MASIPRLALIPLLAPLLFSSVNAGSVAYGGACNLTNNRLSPETKQFSSDCTATTFCNSSGLCDHKGCRRDEYPFGYRLFSHIIPDRCDKGQFCPDEEDACQDLMAVGSLCQLNRDDECAPPPNWRDLAGTNNFNGSVCLNYQCMYANATLGNTCVVENTPYVGYEAGTGTQFVNVVSRGNCVNGLYCDAVSLVCIKQKDFGESCTADKECSSDNCSENGTCGNVPSASKHLPVAVYIVVALCIVLLMGGILASLYFVHRRHRAEEREKRAQYWREQEQFRQNIMQMREQARTSLLSLPWQSQPASPRGGMGDRDYPPSENSQTGMMHAASQPSGLRNEFSDNGYDDESKENGSTEETLVMRSYSGPKGMGGNGATRRGPAGKRF